MYIKIENFNAHEVSELEIQEDSLTVITGVNDHGKSSVLQALYWVVTDGIMGDKFIHFGKDFTAVTVSSDENDRCMWSIRKERILAGKTIFTVIVNGEKNIYFKNEVPEVVIRLFV